MENNNVKVSKSNVEYVTKKERKIRQKPSRAKTFKPDKGDFRNALWIIMLFIILIAVLIALPYISNYR